MMQLDEDRAIAVRQRHREVLQHGHARFNGQITQYYGDGTLSIFQSAVEAVECAVAMQSAFMAGPKIPVRIGLLNENGAPIAFSLDGGAPVEEALVVLDGAERTVRLEGVASPPVVSALRGFSAPVTLRTDALAADRYLQLAADPDLFNRWEAGQDLAQALILGRARGAPNEAGEARYSEAIGRALADPIADHAFKALVLGLPDEGDLALAMAPGADPAAIHEARAALRRRLAGDHGPDLEALHDGLAQNGFSPDAGSAGRRALRNAALDLLAWGGGRTAPGRARAHFRDATNMTDAIGGLTALMTLGGEPLDAALAEFYARWKDEPLVVDKWFALQARDPSPGALGRVLGLTAHPAFDTRTPNRFRALVGGFSQANPARFHDPDGGGYRFLADQILAIDPTNPNVAARMIEPLASWRRYRPELAGPMKAELERIAGTEGLSKNVFELATKALDG